MTGPGRPTLGKSEYREPVHNDCRRRLDRHSSRLRRCLTQGVQSTPPGGTSGVAEIAENKFYVARSAPLG